MTKQQNWIIKYIFDNGCQDIFMEDFVEAYISHCQPSKVESTIWGADKVPELGKYLSELYKQGTLDRFTVGLKYQCDGSPKSTHGTVIDKKNTEKFNIAVLQFDE